MIQVYISSSQTENKWGSWNQACRDENPEPQSILELVFKHACCVKYQQNQASDGYEKGEENIGCFGELPLVNVFELELYLLLASLACESLTIRDVRWIFFQETVLMAE